MYNLGLLQDINTEISARNRQSLTVWTKHKEIIFTPNIQ